MPRFATLDIGTNSVLLLVADRDGSGRFTSVLERAELTRLGRGVDRTGTLSPEGIDATLEAVRSFVDEARALGAEGIAITATSAARDASNGQAFLEEARKRTRVEVEIIGGDVEARLTWRAVVQDFGGPTPLCVIDIGGGSTEFIHGTAAGHRTYERSLDVGSVRLTERFLASDPPTPEELANVLRHLSEALAQLPPPPPGARIVGVAGTVTTLQSVALALDPYDASRIHGSTLSMSTLAALTQKLAAMPVEARRALPGLQPKRADVIVAGALILLASMQHLGAQELLVGDRGVRWGLMAERFGGGAA